MLIYLWIYTFILIIPLFWRMAEHRGRCYIPDSCPCTWKDREFLSGEVIATPCYTWWVTWILHTSKSSGSSHKGKLIWKCIEYIANQKRICFLKRQLQDASFIRLSNRLERVGRLLGECFWSLKEAEDIQVKKQSRTNSWFHTYQLTSERKVIWHFENTISWKITKEKKRQIEYMTVVNSLWELDCLQCELLFSMSIGRKWAIKKKKNKRK